MKHSDPSSSLSRRDFLAATTTGLSVAAALPGSLVAGAEPAQAARKLIGIQVGAI